VELQACEEIVDAGTGRVAAVVRQHALGQGSGPRRRAGMILRLASAWTMRP
jgi:hypothetical protein